MATLQLNSQQPAFKTKMIKNEYWRKASLSTNGTDETRRGEEKMDVTELAGE